MPHDVCLVLLLFVVLANLETTISIHHSHPSMRVLSRNMSSSFTSADPVRIEASTESNLVQNVSSILLVLHYYCISINTTWICYGLNLLCTTYHGYFLRIFFEVLCSIYNDF
jgi:hypothetical protein